MLKSMINPRSLLVLAVLFVVHDHCFGTVYESSWIFRSEVTQGQNMWQAGTHTGHAFPYEYAIPTGWLQGTGISCAVQADPGTVVGNVEGNLKAQYQKHVAGTGKTNIVLSYSGINDESRIGTRFGVNLTATPRLKVDLPWPIPDINAAWKMEFLDLSMATAKDFTTGLGQLVTETGHNEIAALGADLVLANAAVKLHLDQNIFFTPKSIVGTVTATHMATGTTTTETVTLITDGTDVSVELDLDKGGYWEISLDDFRVDENAFRQALGFAAELNVAVPIVSFDTSIFLGAGETWDGNEFALMFDNHGFDGNPATTDNLGRFCLYVEAPEPATLGLLVLGGVAMFRRRFQLAFTGTRESFGQPWHGDNASFLG